MLFSRYFAIAIFSTIIGVFFSFPAGCADVDSIKKYNYKSNRSKTRSPSRAKYHTVRKGETLYRIAKRYGVSVSQLKRVNGISNVTDIPVGLRLQIPTYGGPTTSTASRNSSTKKSRRVKKAYSKVKFRWPMKKVDISSRYGIRGNKKHDGLDMRAPKGTPILAAAPGEVIFSGWGPAGYGNIVIVKHDEVYISVYAHNSSNLAKKGARVKRGETIAKVGNTGRATGYHVHFEIRKNRKPVNPERYLP